MKSVLKWPRYGLGSPAIWSVIFGVAGSAAIFLGGLPLPYLALSLTFLVLGVMIWQEQVWAVRAGVALYTVLAVLRLLAVVFAFSWKHVAWVAFCGFIAWDCWNALRSLSNPLAEFLSSGVLGNDEDANSGQEDAGDDDGPMISFVLLQRNAKYLEASVLTRIIQSAWGDDAVAGDLDGQQDDGEEDDGTGFVVGESPLFVVKSASGMYLIHNHDRPYWDELDEVVESIQELRLRKAVADHTAWLSVDLVSESEQSLSEADQYALIIKLINELADEDTLAIFRPGTMEINVWSEDLAARLEQPDAYEMFAEPDNVPVIPISGDDPHMRAAVATAKQRWPEFVQAFEQRSEGYSDFCVKAKITVDEVTEYIWVDVIGMEPKYVHGNLANDPVDLGDLKLGSQVEFPIDDVQDWCYMKDDEPVGLFSLEAIKKAQQAQQSGETPE